jgi:hypothetical protein
MDQFPGVLDLRNESVRKVLFGGEALGYEAKKAELFFKNNSEVKKYAQDLVKFLDPEIAQKRFSVFCRFSKPARELVKDLFLEKIKNEAGEQKELTLV